MCGLLVIGEVLQGILPHGQSDRATNHTQPDQLGAFSLPGNRQRSAE